MERKPKVVLQGSTKMNKESQNIADVDRSKELNGEWIYGSSFL